MFPKYKPLSESTRNTVLWYSLKFSRLKSELCGSEHDRKNFFCETQVYTECIAWLEDRPQTRPVIFEQNFAKYLPSTVFIM